MSEDGGPAAKRTKLPQEEYDKLSREELLQKLYEQDAFIENLQAKQGDGEQGGEETTGPKDAEEKLKQQQVEATRRENVLVMRLTTKEQEMQEYLNQIAELKQVRNPATTQLRGMLLDPAINLMFQRMKKEMDSCKEKLEQAQNDLAAWKFTPDSQTGKRLMAKCRMLLQENEELGKMISTGRTAKLEGEIALEKKFVEEMKKSQAETDEFLVEMDEDMEGMQSTIYFLQQQLKDAKDEVVRLTEENARLRQQQETSAAITSNPSDSHANNTALMDDTSYMEEELTRTTNVGLAKPSYPPHTHTGNNMRTNESESSPMELRTAPASSIEGATINNSNKDDFHPHPQQTFDEEDRKQGTAATNGDHSVAMETDTSELEPSSSCEDEALKAATDNNHTNVCTSPKPGPESPSNAYNHGGAAYKRVSQSSEGAYTYEDTDSDTWSPSNQSKTSEDDTRTDNKAAASAGTEDDIKYRTDSKVTADRGAAVHNGLIIPQYTDRNETEMAAD